jgi:hypothetical protein
MPRPLFAKILSALVASLFLVPAAECSGQEQPSSYHSQASETNDALLRHFKNAFPEIDISRVHSSRVFEDQSDYRETLGSSVDGGTPRTTSTVVEAEVNSEMGMQFNTVTLDVILCDERQALDAIEGEISAAVSRQHLQVSPRGWSQDGILDVTSRQRGNIFKSPPLWEDVSLLVDLGKSLSDQRALVTLIYDVKSGLHNNDPFTEGTMTTEVSEYMIALNKSIRFGATKAIRANCTKVSSGKTKSKKDAIQAVNARLSKDHQDQLGVRLQGNK